MMIAIFFKQNDDVNHNKVIEDALFNWIYHDLANII